MDKDGLEEIVLSVLQNNPDVFPTLSKISFLLSKEYKIKIYSTTVKKRLNDFEGLQIKWLNGINGYEKEKIFLEKVSENVFGRVSPKVKIKIIDTYMNIVKNTIKKYPHEFPSSRKIASMVNREYRTKINRHSIKNNLDNLQIKWLNGINGYEKEKIFLEKVSKNVFSRVSPKVKIKVMDMYVNIVKNTIKKYPHKFPSTKRIIFMINKEYSTKVNRHAIKNNLKNNIDNFQIEWLDGINGYEKEKIFFEKIGKNVLNRVSPRVRGKIKYTYQKIVKNIIKENPETSITNLGIASLLNKKYNCRISPSTVKEYIPDIFELLNNTENMNEAPYYITDITAGITPNITQGISNKILKLNIPEFLEENKNIFPSPQSIAKYFNSFDRSTINNIRNMLPQNGWISYQNKWILSRKYESENKISLPFYSYKKYMKILSDNAVDRDIRTLAGMWIINKKLSSEKLENPLNLLNVVEQIFDFGLVNVSEYFNNYIYKIYMKSNTLGKPIYIDTDDVIIGLKSKIFSNETKELILGVFLKQLLSSKNLNDFIKILNDKNVSEIIVEHIRPHFKNILMCHFKSLFGSNNGLTHEQLVDEINLLLKDGVFISAFHKEGNREKIYGESKESIHQFVLNGVVNYIEFRELLDLYYDERLPKPFRELCLANFEDQLNGIIRSKYRNGSIMKLKAIMNNLNYPKTSRVLAGKKLVDLIVAHDDVRLLNRYILDVEANEEIKERARERYFGGVITYFNRAFPHTHLQRKEKNTILDILFSKYLSTEDKKKVIDNLVDTEKFEVLPFVRNDVRSKELKEYVNEKIEGIKNITDDDIINRTKEAVSLMERKNKGEKLKPKSKEPKNQKNKK